MPNGKRSSGASGTAEFASSAIAFRRIDHRLKPRLNASARLLPRASRTTREASGIQRARRKSFAPKISRAAVTEKRARGVVAVWWP
jgi:hypothetical protein